MNRAFKTTEGRTALLAQYDGLMEKLTVPHKRFSVDTAYGETSVVAAGDVRNTPMLLLHGSSMNSAMWINDLPEFSERYRVYALDIPGEPGHSDERQLPFHTEDYAEWLLDVYAALGIKSAVLVGASLGAWLALKFAVGWPEKALKLVLLCPAGIGGQNHAFKEVAMSLLPKGEEGMNELFRQINGGNEIPQAMLNYQKLIALCFNSRQEAIPLFTDTQLQRLTMPGIAFVGEKDIMLNSRETAQRIRRLLPHFEVVELPGRGHSLAGLSNEIMTFLEQTA